MGFQREMMFVVQFVMRWGVVMLVMQICLAMRITGQQTDTRATSRVIGPAGVVTVPGGRIRGQRVRLTNRHLSAVDQYLGVPYARPPTGHLRFRPPQSPPVSWTEVRNATKLSPACPQVVRTAEADMPRWKSEPLRHRWPYLQVMDEDCLFLNVYVPTKGE
ncbi:neuroligin-3-like [Asterias rubens]|uniref:neuroligin-3-like n=1 Tax=Asterias rubens TaxID=7604 RepID=UPI00145500D7|nr:neuroligin-3-like [Asterias rubens]